MLHGADSLAVVILNCFRLFDYYVNITIFCTNNFIYFDVNISYKYLHLGLLVIMECDSTDLRIMCLTHRTLYFN